MAEIGQCTLKPDSSPQGGNASSDSTASIAIAKPIKKAAGVAEFEYLDTPGKSDRRQFVRTDEYSRIFR
jgi:hypothetical protein